MILLEFVQMVFETLFAMLREVITAIFRRGQSEAGPVGGPETWIVIFFRVTGAIGLGLILLFGLSWVRARGWWPFT